MRKALALSILLATACSNAYVDEVDGGPTAGSDAAVGVDGSMVVDAAPSPDAWVPGSMTFTVVNGPYHVDAGVEQTYCVVVDLGNTVPMMLRGVHTHLSEGSHHLVVSRADSDPLSTAPIACPPLAHGVGEAIFIAESRESQLVYPSYAGLPMAAHQHIGLELHMIDVGDAPLDIQGSVDLDLVPMDPAIREVHILFTGDMSLNLPPHVMTTVSDLFPLETGADVIAMTTHTHQLGIDATLDMTTSASDPGTRVHESMSWSDPPLTLFDPPMTITAGEQVRLTCVYDNTTDTTVHFGTSFEDEMCFFWAYYLDPA